MQSSGRRLHSDGRLLGAGSSCSSANANDNSEHDNRNNDRQVERPSRLLTRRQPNGAAGRKRRPQLARVVAVWRQVTRARLGLLARRRFGRAALEPAEEGADLIKLIDILNLRASGAQN